MRQCISLLMSGCVRSRVDTVIRSALSRQGLRIETLRQGNEAEKSRQSVMHEAEREGGRARVRGPSSRTGEREREERTCVLEVEGKLL